MAILAHVGLESEREKSKKGHSLRHELRGGKNESRRAPPAGKKEGGQLAVGPPVGEREKKGQGRERKPARPRSSRGRIILNYRD